MLFLWSLLWIVLLQVQQPAGQADIVTVSTTETTLPAGKKSFVPIRVHIKKGYHIQANKVKNNALIPAQLHVTADSIFAPGVPVFPLYKLFRLEGTDEQLRVFDGSFEIRLPVTTAATASGGRYTLQAAFRYQACTSKTCLFPRTIQFDIPVVVSAELPDP